MQVAIAMIVGGRASIKARGGTSGGAVGHASFCGLIWADGECRCWLGASSDPSPKGLGNVFGISKELLTAVDGADVDANLLSFERSEVN
jgi:hypothetical protein